ncbi:hypothetical protein BD414DRAFT_580166 [Trametes punicea]|nr:hypothetical protein BD414DRAFT_580166 [Trametes punicea]
MVGPLQPYNGSVRKLVLGIDVGTTYSGVAYAILDPGEVPRIQGVTRFPGREDAAGDTKIPSILYYNADGTLHSVGAEAALPGIELEAEDKDLVFVEWFKLHLRPKHLDSEDEAVRRRLPPLPAQKSVADIFADFLSYLFRCTQKYICETHANGESLWQSVEDRIEFILSHPNGWGGLQQGKMRQAAVQAGLIPDSAAGRERVHFVTEGEASLNFCLRNGLADEVLHPGKSVMIVDAGGGTVDISSYSFASITPVSVEETVPADCIVQGSTQVNVRAEAFLRERLKDSAFGNDEDIKCMIDHFDKSTKPVFKDTDEASYIKFGSMRDSDLNVNIRRGQLMLTKEEMISFFKPSVEAVVQIVQKQVQAAARPLAAVFLVGGFAASPFLYSALREELARLELSLFRPDAHTNKAVAEGTISFFLEHFVSARVMTITYGIDICTEYRTNDPEHYARRAEKYVQPSGRVVLGNAFSTILTKLLLGGRTPEGTRMQERQEVTETYYQEARDSRTLNSLAVDLLCYRGKDLHPRWTDVNPEMFAPLCTIYADTSGVYRCPKQGTVERYYVQEFEIVLICGLTELQAQIKWTEDGVERRGPAKIVYDDDLRVSR